MSPEIRCKLVIMQSQEMFIPALLLVFPPPLSYSQDMDNILEVLPAITNINILVFDTNKRMLTLQSGGEYCRNTGTPPQLHPN